MDTRFWGPSGWKLLHLICEDHTSVFSPTESLASLASLASFFETIPYILPCKFCRASLTDYYRQHSFSKATNLSKWMYTIHNCVSEKLKKQGLPVSPVPTFASVKTTYNRLLQCSWQEQLQLCWDFLFSVGYHHPKESFRQNEPMKGCPQEVYRCKDSCEKNKWNVLSSHERAIWFRRFWNLLPDALPSSIRPHWKTLQSRHRPTLDSRRSTLAWLWNMRCGLDTRFSDPYTSVCRHLAAYSSDCGRKKGAITCRRVRSRKTKKRTT